MAITVPFPDKDFVMAITIQSPDKEFCIAIAMPIASFCLLHEKRLSYLQLGDFLMGPFSFWLRSCLLYLRMGILYGHG